MGQGLVHVLIDDFVLWIKELIVMGKQITDKLFSSEESFGILISYDTMSRISNEFSHKSRHHETAIIESFGVILLQEKFSKIRQWNNHFIGGIFLEEGVIYLRNKYRKFNNIRI